jgi:hypothetical protein
MMRGSPGSLPNSRQSTEMDGEGGRWWEYSEESSVASRSHGTGSPASGLGLTVTVHSYCARHGVGAGQNGVGQRGGKWLGHKLIGVGGKRSPGH